MNPGGIAASEYPIIAVLEDQKSNLSVTEHSGNSHTSARMMLVGELLKRLLAKRWAVLIADREFIGQEWFAFLKWKSIRRCIRIREDTAVDKDEYVRDCFTSIQPGQVQTLFERAWVYGSPMDVVATLSL